MKKILLSIILVIIGIILLVFDSYRIFINNSNLDNINSNTITFENINRINIDDFAGFINIVKSDKNEISVSDKVNVFQKDNNIYIDSKISNLKNNNIVIYYNDKVNLKIDDGVGTIKGEILENSYLSINNYVGKIELITPEKIFTEINDIIGVVNKTNVFFDNESNTRIIINDSVSTIEIISK